MTDAWPLVPCPGGALSSALSFLLQLSFRAVGQPCAWEGLTADEQRIAGHLCQLGLVYVFKGTGGLLYCPTRLAACLGGGTMAGPANTGSGNMRVVTEDGSVVCAICCTRFDVASMLCQTEPAFVTAS